MPYKIKNVSRTKNNIVIGSRTLKYNDSMNVNEIESLQKLIELNMIEVIYPINIKPSNGTVDVFKKSQKFIDNGIKIHLIESFFNYYLSKDISKSDLQLLKWFYKNIGFTSNISKETLDLLDEVQNQEELTEVLLNNIYPELFEQYTINEKNDTK